MEVGLTITTEAVLAIVGIVHEAVPDRSAMPICDLSEALAPLNHELHRRGIICWVLPLESDVGP